jgi:hypothetical protein
MTAGKVQWLKLLSPLPADARVETKPVASAGQIAQGTAGPIAGWKNVTVHLSEPAIGLRNVHVTLDAEGTLLSGGDMVMFVRETSSDRAVTLSDHESIGGRFETDGSFQGTCWQMRLRALPDSDDSECVSSESSTPSGDQIAALRQLIADVLGRR